MVRKFSFLTKFQMLILGLGFTVGFGATSGFAKVIERSRVSKTCKVHVSNFDSTENINTKLEMTVILSDRVGSNSRQLITYLFEERSSLGTKTTVLASFAARSVLVSAKPFYKWGFVEPDWDNRFDLRAIDRIEDELWKELPTWEKLAPQIGANKIFYRQLTVAYTSSEFPTVGQKKRALVGFQTELDVQPGITEGELMLKGEIKYFSAPNGYEKVHDKLKTPPLGTPIAHFEGICK